jgi:Zn-dependent metalloprotease
MRKTALSLLLSSCCLLSFAQGQDQVVVGRAAESAASGAEMVRYGFLSAPDYIRFRPGREIPKAHLEKYLRHTLNMRPQDGLEVLKEEQDEIGMTHIRMAQTYHGLPVRCGVYYAHLRGGSIQSFNGDFVPGLNVASAPIVTEEAARDIAIAHVGATEYRWENANDEQWIKWNEHNPDATFFPHGEAMVVPVKGKATGGEWTLAWRFDIYAREPWSRQYVYVDALTGEVVWEEERIHTADVPATALTRFSGPKQITTDSLSPTSFRLREVGRGGGIATYDMNTGTDYFTAVDFTDSDNFWNNVNPQQDEVATDAHWGSEMTYDYFFLVRARNSIDGAGFPLNSYVHYDFNFNNAFWDGSVMTYGDGDGVSFYPFPGIDVTGHEITHGLTEFSAGLIYSSESGALNESFSDIFGNVIEHYGRPADHSWLLGEDITTTSGGGAIRDMQNPNAFSCPDTYLGTMWDTWEEVHTNSGVQNKWFFILTDGETGTNDNGDAYSVTGLGWSKSEAIAFRNLTVYLTPSSNYADARFFAIQSATDLYGGCTPEVEATTNAWYAVGVGAAYVPNTVADFEAPTTSFCSFPATVTFSNLSMNGTTFSWNFGDGGTSTALSPSHNYTAPGNYTVTLIADGGSCGRDTLVLTNYIIIDTTLSCDIIMTPGSTVTQTSCEGTLYDSGGPTSPYSTSETSTVIIAPPLASSVSISFSSFNLEDSWDYLYIYDGPSVASPMLGMYTGSSLPAGGSTITATSGTMTIQLQSDISIEYDGFVANWTCVEVVASDNAQAMAAAKVWPNPFSQQLSIELPVAKSGDLKVTAIDPLGREALTLFSGQVAAGTFHHNWMVDEHLPSGTWFICLDLDGQKEYRKVVKMN